jgi:lipoprotein-anchoring transpeptidase ErfK/SrfK
VPLYRRVAIGLFAATSAVIAVAQSSPSAPAKPWVAPGTPGSEIDGTIFHAQVLLNTMGFSTGVIDGKNGMVVKSAIRGFQKARDLPVTGELDGATRQTLLREGNRPSTVTVKLSPADISGDYLYPFPKKPEAQAKAEGLKYRNMLEEVSERYHTTPRTIIALNGPTALIGIGQTLRLPNVVASRTDYEGDLKPEHAALMRKLNVDAGQPSGDHIVVDKSEGLLKVMDKDDKLVAQFPVTTGSGHDPLPIGNWKVTTYAYNPPFHYQPDLFWDVDDGKQDQKLPPGPNGPVGVAWLDLTKEHYGIHGTPEPQTIGRAESHGCIRMTNWDVLRLSRMMKPGFKAVFQA